jgi:hypothetical protein
MCKSELSNHWNTALLHMKHSVQRSCLCWKHLCKSSSGMAPRPDVSFCWISSSDANGDPWVSERDTSSTERGPEIVVAGDGAAPLGRCNSMHCHDTGTNCFSTADWSTAMCFSLFQVLHRLHTARSCALHTPRFIRKPLSWWSTFLELFHPPMNYVNWLIYSEVLSGSDTKPLYHKIKFLYLLVFHNWCAVNF